LKDADGGSAGNIDIVLCAYDKAGKVYDFGALEVQAVYISGNVWNPFEHYMEAPVKNANMDWTNEENYPRPDYLSSSRKRLAPQLIFKGGIIHKLSPSELRTSHTSQTALNSNTATLLKN
jgi:hypothetical protein